MRLIFHSSRCHLLQGAGAQMMHLEVHPAKSLRVQGLQVLLLFDRVFVSHDSRLIAGLATVLLGALDGTLGF